MVPFATLLVPFKGTPPGLTHRLREEHLPANAEAFADPRLDLIIDDCKACKSQPLNPKPYLEGQTLCFS